MISLFNIYHYFQDLYVFLSENPSFVNFDDAKALIWEKNGLRYDDWSAGLNGDGTFTQEVEITPSEVCMKD